MKTGASPAPQGERRQEPVPTDQPAGPGAGCSAPRAIRLAAWFGIVGGYLDVCLIYSKKHVFHVTSYYNQGKHFVWAVPLATLLVFMVPGLVIAGVNRVRPGTVSRRAAVWLFASLALWGPLLRTPLAGAASLVFAAGAGRWISRWFEALPPGPRRLAGRSLAGLVALLGLTILVSYGSQALSEARALARLPAPPARAKNVLLIVLDTVRAESLGLYGYHRETTPNLSRWARKGVVFDRALAPAPWTLPSHGSIFTGRRPSQLNLHWEPTLDPTHPTLAGFLAARGYRTAGFAANINNCSYETGLDRGFGHYEDYPVSFTSVVGSTVPGRWVLRHTLYARDDYGLKWLLFLSRGAPQINRAFLNWLSVSRKGDRPFFAFLNYLDAHEPFVVPEGQGPRFGLRPESRRDSSMLIDYWELDKRNLPPRDVALARDAYDDCIAHLDRHVGGLLDELERRGVLRDTLVIVTSDHGEEFGEHGVFNHGYSLFLHETHVPLVMIGPGSPPGHSVREPVSLCDLPATVVDILGFTAGSPFPGRSLTPPRATDPKAGRPAASPALSEVAAPFVLPSTRGPGPSQRGFATSLVDKGRHYILDSAGVEWLYDVENDPLETHDIKGSADGLATLDRFRTSVLQHLRDGAPKTGDGGFFVKHYTSLLESILNRQSRPGVPDLSPPPPSGSTGRE